MNSLALKFTQAFLKTLAAFFIKKFNPGIIGVTGSVGKTSVKDAIALVLKSVRHVRSSRGNFNGEIGLPITILGEWNPREAKLLSRENPRGKNRIRKAFFLCKIFIASVFRAVFARRKNYPEILVLEYGADKPGDIRELLEIAKPQIGVVTAVGDIPAHVEFYSGKEQVAREKSRLIENLPSNGFAILNADDELVLAMKEKTRAHVITFGFSEEAEVRVTNFESRMNAGRPAGIYFKLEYGGSFVPVRIDNCFGKPVAYTAAAAAATGIVFGMHLVRIAEALAYFESPAHRMRLVSGINDSVILDDSYNASPLSVTAAIETARSFTASRKVAILGDMLEIGEYSIQAHENIGKLAAKVFGLIIAIGPRAKFIAESAKASGFNRRNLHIFDDVEEAKAEVKNLIRKGDLVLIKASWAMRFEELVKELRAQ
ncbi:MAG TPA: UDP-N-acetylmuramoyl-tripeptide--D-alanyl-D-alanine ligase [Candidatus Paceibacterota bacterium]